MARSFLTTKIVPNPLGEGNVDVKIAVCVKLDGLFQNNNGLTEGLGLLPIENVRAMNPLPIIEIETSYSSAARRGVFGKMGFQMQVASTSTPDPGFGPNYKSTVVYSLDKPATEAAQVIKDHEWRFGENPTHAYKTVAGSVVEKRQKRTNPSFA